MNQKRKIRRKMQRNGELGAHWEYGKRIKKKSIGVERVRRDGNVRYSNEKEGKMKKKKKYKRRKED